MIVSPSTITEVESVSTQIVGAHGDRKSGILGKTVAGYQKEEVKEKTIHRLIFESRKPTSVMNKRTEAEANFWYFRIITLQKVKQPVFDENTRVFPTKVYIQPRIGKLV